MAKLSSVQQFGENFLKALQFEKAQRQRQEEFNRTMQFENRQMSLLQDYRNKTLAQDQSQFETTPFETATGDVYTRDFSKQLWQAPPAPVEPPEPFKEATLEPFSVGQKSGFLEKNWLVDPTDTTKRRLEGTGQFYYDEPDGSGGSGLSTQEPKHLDIADKIKGLTEAERIFRTSKDAGQRTKAFDEIKSFSEALISDSQLELERDILWDDHKAGVSFDQTIKNINSYRQSEGKEPLNEQEFDAIRRYYNARFPSQYSKPME